MFRVAQVRADQEKAQSGHAFLLTTPDFVCEPLLEIEVGPSFSSPSAPDRLTACRRRRALNTRARAHSLHAHSPPPPLPLRLNTRRAHGHNARARKVEPFDLIAVLEKLSTPRRQLLPRRRARQSNCETRPREVHRPFHASPLANASPITIFAVRVPRKPEPGSNETPRKLEIVVEAGADMPVAYPCRVDLVPPPALCRPGPRAPPRARPTRTGRLYPATPGAMCPLSAFARARSRPLSQITPRARCGECSRRWRTHGVLRACVGWGEVGARVDSRPPPWIGSLWVRRSSSMR